MVTYDTGISVVKWTFGILGGVAVVVYAIGAFVEKVESHLGNGG